MKAVLANYRQSPRKVRLVANLVRGKTVEAALAELALLKPVAARPLLKLIKSAAANSGESKDKYEKLVIKSIRVDVGRTLKRYRPRAFGRAFPIRKRTSHICVLLEAPTP
jgi:large subunit ribosomal protein L22